MTIITRQVRVIMATGAGSLMSSMELIQDTEKVEPAGKGIGDSYPLSLLMFNFKIIWRKKIEIFHLFISIHSTFVYATLGCQ